ncbi:MAG TPA: hypothetical protein VH325_17315 [Bryobacteraceae bacterium]|nr:hypothetical protein [Bryobacteraceae bacterium]
MQIVIASMVGAEREKEITKRTVFRGFRSIRLELPAVNGSF